MSSSVVETPAYDPARAIGDALKLGASLLATGGVALGIRLLLPRYIGPDAFGAVQFSDSLSAACMIVSVLGTDTYIRKEIATRVEHASDFVAGMVLVRVLIGALVVAALAASLSFGGRSAHLVRLCLLFGVAQLALTLGNSFAALLHAKGAVDGVAILNVASKLLWGAAIVIGFMMGAGVEIVPASLACVETLKLGWLIVLVRRHLGLRWRIDLQATRAMVLASAPFYVNVLAVTVSSKLDVIMLDALASPREVGWYGAAINVASLGLMMTPLIGWVLQPLSSRAAARSQEELIALLHRAFDAIFSLAVPASLLLALGGGWLAVTVFGPAFAPAGASLRVLAPLFVITYVAMLAATMLIRLGRGWTVTRVSIAALLLNASLTVCLIPMFRAHLAPGGAGVGAATALIVTEATVATALLMSIGARAFDRRNLEVISRTALVCLVVCAADAWFGREGIERLALDLALYVGLVVAVGAVDRRELGSLLRRVGMRKGVADVQAKAPKP